MESILKKVLYIIIAFTLVFVSDYLVVKPLLKKDQDKVLKQNDNKLTVLEKSLEKQLNLYSKYSINNDDLNKKSQEWFQVNLRSDITIKFQYSNKTSSTSKFNLFVNDIKIENEEEIYEYDKYKISLYLYGDILVIEHTKSYNQTSFIKIIDITTGEIKDFPAFQEFYINDIIIDEYGLTATYSRLTSKLDYYIDSNETMLTLRVGNDFVSINTCNRYTWPKELSNLECVAFDLNYVYQNDAIDFSNTVTTNSKKLNAFLEPYMKDFNNICKNSN